MPKRDLISIEDLSRDQVELLLDTAESFLPVLQRDIKKVPTLRGRTIVNLFWEASTRTSSSFDLAAKRLSADTIALKASGSAVEKGETLKDTAITLSAYGPDIIVMRHPSAGACQVLSRNTEASVINAGDGKHQHPTQCLLDLFAMRQTFGRDLDGMKVAIVGDILHSRVARSDIMGFKLLGMDVTLVGPPTLIPRGIEEMGVRVEHDLANLRDVDVIYLLRIQKERIKEGANFLPSLREYNRLYGMSRARLRPGQRGHAPRPDQPRRRDRPRHRRRRREPDRPAGVQRPRRAHGDPVPHDRRLHRRRQRGGALMERTWHKPLPAADLLHPRRPGRRPAERRRRGPGRAGQARQGDRDGQGARGAEGRPRRRGRRHARPAGLRRPAHAPARPGARGRGGRRQRHAGRGRRRLRARSSRWPTPTP